MLYSSTNLNQAYAQACTDYSQAQNNLKPDTHHGPYQSQQRLQAQQQGELGGGYGNPGSLLLEEPPSMLLPPLPPPLQSLRPDIMWPSGQPTATTSNNLNNRLAAKRPYQFSDPGPDQHPYRFGPSLVKDNSRNLDLADYGQQQQQSQQRQSQKGCFIYKTPNRMGGNSNKMIKLKHHHQHNQQSSRYHDSLSPNQKQKHNYHHNIDNRNTKHLVKTISDLPVFVTIESYRVASYSISGEPHLCLPQLLQYLKQKFSLKRLIEKFEESMVNFPTATPKQVEGFVKASVLPPSAKTCPLIKRSDADKICLILYEQCFLGKKNDIVDLCSRENPENYSGATTKGKSIEPNEQMKLAHRGEYSQSENFGKLEESSLVYDQQEAATETGGLVSRNKCNNMSSNHMIEGQDTKSTNDEELATVKEEDGGRQSIVLKSPRIDTKETDTPLNDKRRQVSQDVDKDAPQENNMTNSHQASNKRLLFELEAQSSILALAKSVTSTLMIRIYHRCFGKCVGLYYPSLINSPKAKCIECGKCKTMLTPRRFVGHTHGPKENNVCHWGFNSYNWRHYIKLSKTQPMNNLDDDELLVQFKTLQTASEKIDYERFNEGGDEDSDYEFDQPDLEDDVRKTRDDKGPEQEKSSTKPTCSNSSKNLSSSVMTPATVTSNSATNTSRIVPTVATAPLPMTKTAPSNSFDTIREAHAPEIATYSGNPSLMASSFCLPSLDCDGLVNRDLGISHPSTSFSCNTSVAPTNSMSVPSLQSAHFPLCLGSELNNSITSGTNIAHQSLHYPININPDQLQGSKRSSSFSSATNYWSYNRATPSGSSVMRLDQSLELNDSSALDSESKREMYVCSSLASYLSAKGFSSSSMKDLVETTLNLMRRSRLLF